MVGIAGSGDGEYVRSAAEGPGDADLGGRRVVRRGDRRDHIVAGHAATLASGAGDREEGHEGNAFLAADAHHLVVDAAEVDAVAVLDADDRSDGPCLSEMGGSDVGDTQVADQAGVP